MSNAPAESDKARFEAIDGLRGLAIALVLLFHFWQQTWSQLTVAVPGTGLALNLNVLAETGFIGVQLFFLLSGFCIAWPYTNGRPLHAGEFLRRRAAKILPSYWLCLLVIVIWFLPPHLQEVWPRHLLMNLLFLNTWTPEYLYHSFNAVLWSLALEIHFYLLFAAAGEWWIRRSRRVLVASLLLWALYGLWTLSRPVELFDLYRHQLWPHLPFFAAGVALAVFQRTQPRLRAAALYGGLGMALWVGVAYAIWDVRHDPPLLAGTRWPTALEYLYIPLLTAGFGLTLLAALQPGFWNRLFSLRWLCGLGLISYNLYLWHQFLIVRLKQAGIPPLRELHFGQDPQWQLAMWVTAVSLALSLSWLLTHYFEEPLRRRLTTGPTLAGDLRALLTAPLRAGLGRRARAVAARLGTRLPDVPPVAALGGNGLRALLWRHRGPLLLLAATWGLLNAWLQINALQIRDDGIWAGHLNIWSDWPLHIAMATGFADRAPAQWLSSHPMFAHGPLIYPFGVNLLSGLLMRLGLGLDWAMTLPTFVAAVLTPWLLYAVFVQGLRSRRWALVAVALFYLGSGLGGVSFLWDSLSHDRWDALAYPPVEVSRMDRYDWYSGNVLTGMLLPQRAFVFGFPVALMSLLCLLLAVQARVRRPRLWALGGGLLAGLMPLLHTHSFIALGWLGIAVALIYRRQWKVWSIYAGAAAVLGLALMLLFLRNGQGLPNHLRWAPGFAAPGGLLSWLWMWWQLWGLAIPALLIGLWSLRRDDALAWTLFGGGLLCFVFANLVLVQPNRWDNSKLFLWTYFCWAPLWAAALRMLWRGAGMRRVVALTLALALTVTGAVEVWRLARVDRGSYRISSAQEVALAQTVRRETSADAVFLTQPSHNHPIMVWAGRSIFLGFTGWIANLGFDYRPRETDLRRMYAGAPDAAQLLREHGIDYVYVGRDERASQRINEAWLQARYPVAFASGDIRIYAVSTRAALQRAYRPMVGTD
ncbi:acyltransferase [Fontimonas sp. SYSU GA230001]|uniref:acyltransferase n=1 Tax=Fontimonas sp. SYSU GA230001 TaxID=3142450 RepID=UPI0032B5C6C6